MNSKPVKNNFSLLRKKRGIKKVFDIIGMIVTHIQYGEGLITNSDGVRITVEYEDKSEKKYQLPQAFESGYLVSEYPDFLESFKKAKEIDFKVEKISNRIEEINKQLSALMI